MFLSVSAVDKVGHGEDDEKRGGDDGDDDYVRWRPGREFSV